MSATPDPFTARDTLDAAGRSHVVYRLDALGVDLPRLPYTLKVLLENVLRNVGRGFVTEDDVNALLAWRPGSGASFEVPFLPARVVLQDFTGVPCVVDLAAMRDAMAELGGDPALINPLVPADLVIDHSVQVDRFGTADAFAANVEREYERNQERYMLLRWAQQAFADFRVVPPGTGIVHQVNLEHLAPVVQARQVDGELLAFPDTLVGTDSHTTMINGLGVLGFGVGGIEAEAVLLGQPLSQPTPKVIGLKLTGAMSPGTTATDLVLTVTEMLRAHGVVGAFVELYGAGLSSLSVADRATISNMSPEFGATATMFPVDAETLRFLRAHRPLAGDRRAGRGLHQAAGALPHRRRAGPRVRREPRARAGLDRAQPGRPAPPAGPGHPRRRRRRLPRGLRRRPGGRTARSATGRSTSRWTATPSRSRPARSRSPRSPAAPTPRTRP